MTEAGPGMAPQAKPADPSRISTSAPMCRRS